MFSDGLEASDGVQERPFGYLQRCRWSTAAVFLRGPLAGPKPVPLPVSAEKLSKHSQISTEGGKSQEPI